MNKTDDKTYSFGIQQINRDCKTAVLMGCLSFVDLSDKVRFTYRNIDDATDQYYQRKLDSVRVKNIAKYIERTILNTNSSVSQPIFPTSIILAFGNNSLDFSNDTSQCQLALPADILIVDGQHRFAAMRYLYESYEHSQPSLYDEDNDRRQQVLAYLRNYKFNCSVLLNYDIWEQAQVFASVNFNQKKVSKSLFFEIYGIAIPDQDCLVLPKQNEIYIAHQLVTYLNGDEKSPFRGFIKILGTGNGYISQAFLVEQFLKLLSPQGIWFDVTEDLRNGSPKNLQNYAASELAAFLAAVRDTFFDYWPKEGAKQASVLCKTTGIGAMIQFFADLHRAMPTSLQNMMKEAPTTPIVLATVVSYFYKHVRLLRTYGERLFSIGAKGEFNGTGGKGLQQKLYETIFNLWRNKIASLPS